MNTDYADLPREILQSRNPDVSGLFHRVNTDLENKMKKINKILNLRKSVQSAWISVLLIYFITTNFLISDNSPASIL